MNIIIGQYYPIDSPIHRLDPRVKFLSTIIFITVVFFVNNFAGYLISTVFLGLVIIISRIPFVLVLKGLKNILMIIVFTAVLNIFFTPGTEVLFEIYHVAVTKEAILTASRMAARLILLVIVSSALTLTTSPIELTDAIEYILKPFKKMGVPSHEIAMMMTIALRFIPTLVEELNKIRKAQMARGADFDTGGIIKKAKSLIPLLVPLFISSFRRADELAMAMEARCYRGDTGRTRMKQLVFKPIDMVAVLCFFMAVVLILASRFL